MIGRELNCSISLRRLFGISCLSFSLITAAIALAPAFPAAAAAGGGGDSSGESEITFSRSIPHHRLALLPGVLHDSAKTADHHRHAHAQGGAVAINNCDNFAIAAAAAEMIPQESIRQQDSITNR